MKAPLTEEAWRDLILGPRAQDWEYVAKQMYTFAQGLEASECRVELLSSELDAARLDQEASDREIDALEERLRDLTDKFARAREALS